MIKFLCHRCGQKIGLPDENAGRQVPCPRCHAVNRSPSVAVGAVSGGEASAGAESPPTGDLGLDQDEIPLRDPLFPDPAPISQFQHAWPPRAAGPVKRERSPKLMVIVLVSPLVLGCLAVIGYLWANNWRMTRPDAPTPAKKVTQGTDSARVPADPTPSGTPSAGSADVSTDPEPGDESSDADSGSSVAAPGGNAGVAENGSAGHVPTTKPADNDGPDVTFFGVGGKEKRPDEVAAAPTPSGAQTQPNAGPDTRLGVTPTIAGNTGPVKPAPVDAGKTKLADDFVLAAAAAKNDADIREALKRALAADPGHHKANFMLAELLIRAKEITPSLEQLDKLELLAAQDKDALAKLAELKSALAAVRQHVTRWATVRKQYEGRYVSLADQAAPGMPSAAEALGRAVILQPDDKPLAERRQAAEAAIPALPAPAEAPDPKGAKLLREQADARSRAGNHAEAARLLESAYGLGADDPALACDLAVCWTRSGKPANAAALLIHAGKSAAATAKTTEGKALASRIAYLLELADPKGKGVDQLDEQLVQAGRLIRKDAATVADTRLVADLDKCLEAIGGPAAVAGLTAAKVVTAVTPASKINFESREIDIVASPGTKVARFPDGLVIGHDQADAAAEGKQPLDYVTVGLGNLTFRGDWRVSWRIQMDEGKRLSTYIAFWPIPEKFQGNGLTLQDYGPGKWWKVVYTGVLTDNGYEYQQAGTADQSAAFKASGDYIVTFQKKGNMVSAWVDQVKLVDIKLTEAQVQRAATLPMKLKLMRSRDNAGNMKVGVTEFRAGS